MKGGGENKAAGEREEEKRLGMRVGGDRKKGNTLLIFKIIICIYQIKSFFYHHRLRLERT